MNSKIKNYSIVRVSDILEQIDDLNKMIKLHKENSDTSMLAQYEYMRKEFINELNSLLEEFDISVQAA